MRHALVLAALAALSCASEPDNRVPCAAQDTCDKEFRAVCEDGFCSPQLPDISKHYENLTMGLDQRVRLQNPVALRAAVLYAITPDGKTVVCPGTAPGANQVAISSFKDLWDAKKFNLTASPLEMPLRSVNEVITTAVSVNGVGRVVYVEYYADSVQQGNHDSGGAPVGVGCLTDAPFADDPSQATVYLKINPAN